MHVRKVPLATSEQSEQCRVSYLNYPPIQNKIEPLIFLNTPLSIEGFLLCRYGSIVCYLIYQLQRFDGNKIA
jgi:hypothetical protein